MEDIENYIEGLQTELKDSQNKIADLSGSTANSIFNGANDPNLITWQLELDNILERIEHLLRGDELMTDEQGNVAYVTPEDKSLIILNEYGVKLIMNVISFYLNRNTILSNYDVERIFEILYDLGIVLSDLIYINYEKMGMDSTEKKSRYPLLVMNILNTIESAYNRALSGGERESLRSARIVTQSIPMNQQGMMGMGAKKSWSMFKPSTWA